VSEHDHWFEPVAEHLGSAYLRYSFTKGTVNEVDFLVDVLELQAGDRVLDVGCGPGRHAHELGRRGVEVVGIDISRRFIDLARHDAPPGVTFERMDAREMTFATEFDAVISLCQGAFGLVAAGPGTDATTSTDPDGSVLTAMAGAARREGLVAVSAFSSYFMVRYLEDHDTFDAARGVNHERSSVRSESGAEQDLDLWTSCFTPRELRLLAAAAGLDVEHVWSVTPGRYTRAAPDLDQPEFLMIARRH
jgi:SAM-dependent methyltransferase